MEIIGGVLFLTCIVFGVRYFFEQCNTYDRERYGQTQTEFIRDSIANPDDGEE